jgi:hypothetical protein
MNINCFVFCVSFHFWCYRSILINVTFRKFVFFDGIMLETHAFLSRFVPCEHFRHLLVMFGARIAQWYSAGLRTGLSGVPVPAGAGNFSLHHSVQNGSGAHPASYPMVKRGSFPGEKAVGERN